MTSQLQEAAPRPWFGLRKIPRPRGRSLCRMLLWGGLAGLFLAFAAEVCRIELGGNCHTLLDGKAYRCSQPTGEQLEKLIRSHGIRTVINLRGNGIPMPWYVDECRATCRTDVAMEDVCLSAARMPSVHEVRRLIDVLDHCEYPVLFHCHRGADRTGLACAVLYLTRTDADFATARHQLGLRYGHVALGKAAELDAFLDLYEAWLHQQNVEHSSKQFRAWIEDGYREYNAEIELIAKPKVVRPTEVSLFEVRVHNTSCKSWRFQVGRNAGIHACYMVHDDRNKQVLHDRAGLIDAVVEPGESIDLKLPVPPLLHPGTYRLMVDMSDEQHCMFHQIGSEPLEIEFEVTKEPRTK